MAKIISIYDENTAVPETGPRQLAVQAGKLTMIVEFAYLLVDSRQGLKGKELKAFISKYEALDREELLAAIEIREQDFMRIVNQVVDCIGCRRIIERMFQQFKNKDSLTLDPIQITKDGVVRIRQEHLDRNLDVCKMLQKSILLYAGLDAYKQTTKQGIRCTIHNLDAYKVCPFSETWTQVWNSMKNSVREKILIISMEDLQTTLDVYLKKHRFCHECSAKVETAFQLLFKEKNLKKEPGYSDELYAGIKRCLNQHIQLPCKVDYIDKLIQRAEPELVGNGKGKRERHAKNLQVAQEEVLTCIGMCIFERLRRIYTCRKEEEGACQLLAILALHGMYRSFELAVERKRGISNLELLYEEIAQEEQRQELKKEQKRLKKRQKKLEKRSFCSNCKTSHKHIQSEDEHLANDEEGEEEEDGAHSCDDPNNNHSEDDDEEYILQMHVKELEMRKSRSKSNSTGRTTTSGKPTTKPDKQKKRMEKDSSVETKKEQDNSPICNSCDSSLNRPLRMQHPFVDCGYVSDQLSLTNCSNTSSSSDDVKAVSTVVCKSPINEMPDSSSPLTIDSQLSSLTSSPEGSEVACHDGLCNHSASPKEPEDLEPLTLQPITVINSTLSGSYIPEEQINEFHSKHRNLKAVREELRKNLRQNFAQFCLENKNRPLSHLCRTGKCLTNASLENGGLCSGDCE